MRKKLFIVFSLLFALSFATLPAMGTSIPGRMATPAGANLETYPVENGPLSLQKMADYGLQPMRLSSSWTGYDYYGGLRGGRWVLETLPAGTMVLADINLHPVYKADCGNRLVPLEQFSTVLPTPVEHNPQEPSLWGMYWDALKSLARGLLWILALLAVLLFFLACLMGLWMLARALWHTFQGPKDWDAPPATVISPEPEPGPGPVPSPTSVVPKPASAPPAETPKETPLPPASPKPEAEGEGEAEAEPQPEQPHFLNFYAGSKGNRHKVKFSGYRQVAVTSDKDGSTTIHFL